VGISVDLQSAADTHPAYQRLAAVDEHIRAHFHQPISMGELTRIAGISVAQLERYCKRVFHLTPRQMIHKARLEHAHRCCIRTCRSPRWPCAAATPTTARSAASSGN
jgi:AraC-like DNA-binding protein